MVILTKGEAVRWMIISCFGKRHKVRGIHEREVMLWQPNPETAGDALIVVKFDYPPAKRGGATWQFLFDCILGYGRPDVAQIYSRLHEMHSQLRPGVRKVTGDKRIAKPRSEKLIGDKHIPTLDEPRKNASGV